VNIACSINRDYIHPMCVMLNSLSVNTSYKVKVHVLHTELRQNDEEYIQQVFKYNEKIDFSFYRVNTGLFSNMTNLRDGLSIETFFRLLLPLEIPDNIDKVLYIDADVVVNDDVFKVYNTDIDDYFLAGVVDVYEPFLDTIKFQSITDYFNAGVLLINLKKWREENFLTQCIEYTNEYPERIIMEDQDILNGTLQGEWKRLPLKWNVTRNLIFNTDPYYKYISKKEVDDAIQFPSLIHYTSNFKPWKLIDNHPYKDKYHLHLRELGIPIEDKSVEWSLIKQKRIVLFGASAKALEYKAVLEDLKLEISFYVDNDTKKWNKEFFGKSIKSPSELTKNPTDYFVVISSQYVREISQQISEYGFKKVGEGYLFQ